MIEKTPLLGTQVKYLELHGDFDDNYSVTQLLHFFPHLCGIKILLDHSKDAHIFTFNTNEESKSLPSQIEFIEDCIAGELMRAMTEIGFFCHLVTLKLNLRHVFTSDEMSDICHQIVNMPVLKKLEITNFSLKPSHCELIHTQVPSLTSLDLYAIEDSEENLPIDIQPATSITNFTIDLIAFTVEEQNKWANYIAKKYPQIKHLEFNNSYSFSTDAMIDQYYKVTIPTLLNSLGSQLESLHIIHEPIDLAFFNTLDDAGCKIKNLVLGKTTQIDILIRSKQSRYIETLVLEIDSSLSFEWLSHMKVLRSFSCGYIITRSRPAHSSPFYLEYKKRMTINATNLFYSCSDTVESMDIPVEFIDFNTKKKKVFPITKLAIDCKWWPKEVDTFISNCLFHLKSLTIRICTRDDENLAFPNHHFDYLDIDFNSCISCTIALTTLNDDTTRYYNESDPQLQTGQFHFDDYIYPITEPDDKGYLKIVCGSVKDLVIEGLHAHLVSS